MADSTTVESSTETASATTTQGGNVTDLQAQLDKAIKEREKANQEAAAYRLKEKERIEKEQADQGKHAELSAALQKERDELAAKATALETLNAEKTAKLEAIEKARKTELLSKLPAEKRASYEGFDLTVLEQIAKDFAGAVPSGNSQGNDRGAASSTAGEKPEYTPSVPFESASAKTIGMLNKIFAG